MSELIHYETLLEVYKNQEIILTERSEELDELGAKYQTIIQALTKLRKEREMQNMVCNQNKVKLMERLDSIVTTCKDNSLSWAEIKVKQSCIHVQQEKLSKVTEEKIEVLQDLVKNHKQLDTELCSDKILSKIQDYQHKSNILEDLILKSKDEVKEISNCAPKASEFQVFGLAAISRGNVTSRRKLSKMYIEIDETKKQLQTITFQMKELEGPIM